MKPPAVAENTEIKYSEVILLGESQQLDSNADEDLTYQSLCNLQTYSICRYSPLPVSEVQTPQDTRTSEKCMKSSTRTKITSNTDLCSCPSVYSNILLSHTIKRLPSPLLSSSYIQSTDWQQSTVSVNDTKLQLGGDSEPRSDSPLSQTDGLKTFPHFLRQHQSPLSFSDFISISHSTALLSHATEVTSAQGPFSQSLHNLVPSLQSNTLTHPDAFTTSLSPFPHSVLVDFSYYPL